MDQKNSRIFFKRCIWLCLLSIYLCGCSGVGSRIKEYRVEFDTYPPEIQRLLKKGKIREGFTHTQIYIALGEPFDRQYDRWTYTSCAWRNKIALKSDFEYETEYDQAWTSYQNRKKKNKDAVFIPPSRVTEDKQCRRYVSRFVYFENDRVSRIERPLRIIWVEPEW